MNPQRRIVAGLLPALLIVMFAAAAPSALAQPFTYQGRLDSAPNTPASGNYDFQCALYTAVSGGAQVGLAQQFNNVAVTSGLFTITPSFPGGFTGEARFLEVRV